MYSYKVCPKQTNHIFRGPKQLHFTLVPSPRKMAHPWGPLEIAETTWVHGVITCLNSGTKTPPISGRGPSCMMWNYFIAYEPNACCFFCCGVEGWSQLAVCLCIPVSTVYLLLRMGIIFWISMGEWNGADGVSKRNIWCCKWSLP